MTAKLDRSISRSQPRFLSTDSVGGSSYVDSVVLPRLFRDERIVIIHRRRSIKYTYSMEDVTKYNISLTIKL